MPDPDHNVFAGREHKVAPMEPRIRHEACRKLPAETDHYPCDQYEHDERGEETQQTSSVKAGERDTRECSVLLDQERGYEETAEHEEKIHAEVAPSRELEDVIAEHQQDGYTA